MPLKWVVEAGFPQGHAVEMTAEEVAAYDAMQADVQARAIAQATEDTNASTIRTRMANALANLEAAYTNWDTLTNVQKDAAMKLTVRTVAGLIRLFIRQLDAAGTGG